MLASLQHFVAGDLAGLSAVSLFAILFFATFVSEDGACIAAGALVATGEITLIFAIAACGLGIVTGDFGLYWIGRLVGPRIFAFPFAKRFLSDASLSRASAWLEERGASAVFLSRFVTGLRLPTYLAAGFLRTSFRKFALYFVLAAAIWTPILVASVAFAGELFPGSLVIAAVAVFVLIRVAMKLGTWRGRRMLIGRVRRLVRWEFWPLPVFYLPVVCYVLILAVRYRSLTVFTCANPAMPAGGFVGESKDAIFSLIASAAENQEYLLRYAVVRAGIAHHEKLRAALSFMHANELSFPVVLKPDAGERGKGVRIIDSADDLAAALAAANRDLIIQEYFGGGEASIFYHRHPLAESGEIFSITEKVFPSVTGDGVSTIEELILDDARAVCLAAKYFEENAARSHRVPRKGERVSIIRIGTHSRGAIFLDGGHLRTSGLEIAIDAICRRIKGFNFGRFDIRFSSVGEFRCGRGFKIIELNGVTSESTNIYDPRYSLFDAYRILFAQWRLAFEIGQANRRRGAVAATVRHLLRAAYSM